MYIIWDDITTTTLTKRKWRNQHLLANVTLRFRNCLKEMWLQLQWIHSAVYKFLIHVDQ